MNIIRYSINFNIAPLTLIFYPIRLIRYFRRHNSPISQNVNNNCRGQTREFLQFYDENVTIMTKRYFNRKIALWPAKITGAHHYIDLSVDQIVCVSIVITQSFSYSHKLPLLSQYGQFTIYRWILFRRTRSLKWFHHIPPNLLL